MPDIFLSCVLSLQEVLVCVDSDRDLPESPQAERSAMNKFTIAGVN